jgi:hypothetical protein
MPFWLFPAAVAVLGLGAWYKRKPSEPISENSIRIFNAAMVNLKDPAKLATLAASFAAAGFAEQAAELQKRVLLFSLPEDVKAFHDDTFRRAMSSKNVSAILATADAFEKMAAYGAARELRAYASLVQVVLSTPLPKSPTAGVRSEPSTMNDPNEPAPLGGANTTTTGVPKSDGVNTPTTTPSASSGQPGIMSAVNSAAGNIPGAPKIPTSTADVVKDAGAIASAASEASNILGGL